MSIKKQGYKKNRMTRTLLKCVKCNNVYTHLRVQTKKKKKGHHKKIWCYKCNEKTLHRTIY